MNQDLLEDTQKNFQHLLQQSGMSIDSLVKSLLSSSPPVSISSLCVGPQYEDSNKYFGEQLRNHWLYSKKNIDLGLPPCCNPTQTQELNQSDPEQKCVLTSILNLIHQTALQLNKTAGSIIENVLEQMVTKKTYKIRQSFRELILELLGVKQLMFYAIHESGRIEFQDFASNFITQIIESQPKYEFLSNNKIISTKNFQFGTFQEGSDWFKLFEIDSIDIQQYIGITIQKGQTNQNNNISFIFMIKAKNTQKVKQKLTEKWLKKMIEVCEINISDGSQFIISKNYAIKMLDLLELFILQYETELKKSLIDTCKMGKEGYHSVDSIVKVALSKIDENMANEELILKIRKSAEQIEQTQYKKVEEIRLYKKYLRQNNTTLLEFNRVGILLFMSGNHDNQYLNPLTQIWREGKPVLDLLFGQNKVLDDQIKKAIKGICNSERLFEIESCVKAKIMVKGKRIEKIQIFVEDEENCLANTPNDCSNMDTMGSQFDKSEKLAINILKQLEKENPGIKNQGWIDLFLKNTIKNHRRRSTSNARKQNSNSGLLEKTASKLLRVSSCTVSKQVYHCLDGICLDNPNLNFLIFSDIELESFAIRLFESLEYFQRLPREMNKLQNFISDLHDNYEIHSNPFHNFKHGINVMHSCYLLSNLSSNFNILNKKDIFINVFSGLCHDVGHTGFTNAFEIASMSRKAMIYNDKSPLQNFHASLTFELLRKEQNNFLCHLSKEQFNVFRKGVIENILFTDIKQHFPLLNRFNDLVKSGKTLGPEDATLVSCMIIHSGDFAGSIKDFSICKQWSIRVNQQFSKQYTVEGELGLPQSPFMKDVTNPLVLSKGQGGFLKVIVYPLYEALDSFYMSETFIHQRKKNIENNIKEWEEMYASESEKNLKAKSK